MENLVARLLTRSLAARFALTAGAGWRVNVQKFEFQHAGFSNVGNWSIWTGGQIGALGMPVLRAVKGAFRAATATSLSRSWPCCVQV